MMTSGIHTACSAVASASMWIGGPDVPHVLRSIATGIFCVQVTLILTGAFPTPFRLPVIFEPWRTVPPARGLAESPGAR